MSDLTQRLRAHDINISPEWDEANDQHLWCDTADALLSEAADEIERLTAALAEAREALKASSQLIDRMMHVHVAPDECTSYVEGSRRWFMENGGSLAAIADQQAMNHRALKEKP